MGRSFANPERLPSTGTLLGPSPISHLCRSDSDHDAFSPTTGFPQRARSPVTQPTRIDCASRDLTPSLEICNYDTTCEHICEPRIPASDRADCPTCHAAAMTSLRRRLRRGPHDPPSPDRLPDLAKGHLGVPDLAKGPLAWRRTTRAGRTRVERAHEAPVPHSKLLPSLPSSPIRAVQDWDVSCLAADRPRPPLHHVPATGRDFAKTGQLSTCRDSRVTRRIAPGARGNRSPPPSPFTSYE